VFLCGPTGFAVVASAALFAATDRAIAEDVELVRTQAAAAHRSAGGAVDAFNLSSTHLQRFIAARRRELDALENFRGSVQPLTEAAGSPTPLAAIRRQEEVAASTQQAIGE
jgi:DNA recombination protein RmuC